MSKRLKEGLFYCLSFKLHTPLPTIRKNNYISSSSSTTEAPTAPAAIGAYDACVSSIGNLAGSGADSGAGSVQLSIAVVESGSAGPVEVGSKESGATEPGISYQLGLWVVLCQRKSFTVFQCVAACRPAT